MTDPISNEELDPATVASLIERLERAEAENGRLREFERKSVAEGMLGSHRYWEARYRDEAAENVRLRAALAAARNDALEEAVEACEACDKHTHIFGAPASYKMAASYQVGRCAQAIRALKEKPE